MTQPAAPERSLELILGGARSGKSRLAEERARASGQQLVYIATATAGDAEMATRIHHHQARRGPEWQLLEAPLQLAATLLAEQREDRCLLVDCLTLWLSNCLHRDCWQQERQALLDAIPQLRGRIIFVSNEVGSGIVPLGALSREFADASGFLHQQLAQLCQRVTLTVAGLPLELKQEPPQPGNQAPNPETD
ncbi:bifunctional adenosylcobinamide kinase/adenosylcobinamide-phosphate guanylyltransferase [Pseudomaricurvus alcaniphilus]|uniref:bifunctional adenosylcobinamide kinase/adenosylcobinamide-phosphate guanylyltransferase n=1 Tax=Pseudomaricurvus alcaniphilus TaxID=1166482 RepID=UPI001407EC53|nr:bifunctional adenosylcobinamide kinase/adenosylcobinamide-phosphate guanylyltransferase [Pseudomaricurvus alcaniphilus]NHN37250.1 bifunctional adenosylcobinamide kinase/adenosylcobinamide-phosphate guanylyltransferase [Pseudomaricurvus alcaniphilus]